MTAFSKENVPQNQEKTDFKDELALMNRRLDEVIFGLSSIETVFTKMAGGVTALKISVVKETGKRQKDKN